MKTMYIFLMILSLCLSGCTKNSQNDFAAFEESLEKWRIRLKMPAFSTSIVKNKEIIWSKGFGYADVDGNVPATENTVYHLASLTKPFASVILMQLVEEGKISLDDPISKYGINLTEARDYGMELGSEDQIKVKHLLTHTAQGNPGSYYQYSGFLYGYLGKVIQESSGKSFAELLVQNITKPLQLNHTVPNIEDSTSFSYTGLDSTTFSIQCARPYVMDSLNTIKEGKMESYFGASAGLMSSAVDMASFSIAVENRNFLRTDTWEEVLSPTISVNGDTLPYGYGWFIQRYKGLKIIWHYGFWNTNSSLIMMVPEKGYNFVILANTNLLSRPFGLGGSDGNVFHSPFAIEFARSFLFEDTFPDIDLEQPVEQLKEHIRDYENSNFKDLMILELFALASAHSTIGDTASAVKAYTVYNDIFTHPIPDKFNKAHLIIEINSVGDLANEVKEFSLAEESKVLILSIGEGIGAQMYDYGWIENAATGDTLWKMTMDKTSDAGGANKNRLVDTTVRLLPGRYQLHFISDKSHSFNHWNAIPPDLAFYGIALYRSN
jgi:CubicO group peptidase (beta-lactamase class C family)